MKFSNDPAQGQLFDPFERVISPMGRKHIADGWQGMFRDVILQLMPVAKVGEKFSGNNGRPTAELYSMIGLLMIRQFQGWTVPQTHEAALFRTDIQFALNLHPGFKISQRTIERHLRILQDDEHLNQEIFDRITDELLSKLEVSVKKQRLDSTHVLSDMATFGRAQMIGVTLRRFFAKVDRHHGELLQQFAHEETDKELLGRYRRHITIQVSPT